MTQKYFSVLTTKGLQACNAANAKGAKLPLKYLAIGDANGSLYDPTIDQTSLVHELYRVPVQTIVAENDDTVAIAIIPASVGGFWVREVGIFDDNGNLLQVGNLPESNKPVIADGSTKDMTIKMIITPITDTGVTISIDPAVINATTTYVDKAISNQMGKIDLSPYLKLDGSTPMQGDLSLDGHQLKALKQANTSGQAMEYSQLAYASGYKNGIQQYLAFLNGQPQLSTPVMSLDTSRMPTRSINTVNPSTDIDISAGVCADINFNLNLNLPQLTAKRCTLNWSLGSNAGCFIPVASHTTLEASSTYPALVISNGTITDVCILHNSALDSTGEKLTSVGVSAILAQTGWTKLYYRRFACEQSLTATTILQKNQFGNLFKYLTSVTEAGGGWTTNTPITMTIPAGVLVKPIITIILSMVGVQPVITQSISIGSTLSPNLEILGYNICSGQLNVAGAGSGSINTFSHIPTNNGQLIFKGDSCTVYNAGYYDNRGSN